MKECYSFDFFHVDHNAELLLAVPLYHYGVTDAGVKHDGIWGHQQRSFDCEALQKKKRLILMSFFIFRSTSDMVKNVI